MELETISKVYFILAFAIGMSLIIFTGVYLFLDYLFGRKLKFLRNSYLSLYQWVKSNNIGNATNLVKSISNESDIESFFRNRQNKILTDHKESYALKWMYLDRNSFLVETIRELITELDVATRNDLFFLEKYLNYETPDKTLQGKVLNGLFSLSAVTGFLACIKFSLDILLKGIETKNDDILNLGKVLIGILVVVFIVLCVWVYRIVRKRNLERNSKNFLDLVFKVLKEEG